ISCLGIVLLAGCSGPEKKAGALVVEASQLVHAAQEAEKTSYSDAFKLYHAALVKAETIATRYPLSQVAAQLAQGEVKIGPYTLTALKNTLVPQTKRKAETEENPLACALVIAKTITDSSRQAGVLEQIALVYIEVGQYLQALQIASMMEDAHSRAWLLAEIAGRGAKGGQKDKALGILSQALQIARTIGDASRKNWVLDQIARSYAAVGQYDQALQIAHSITDARQSTSALVAIACIYAEAGHYNQALQIAHSIADTRQST